MLLGRNRVKTAPLSAAVCLVFAWTPQLLAQDVEFDKQVLIDSLRNREAVENACFHAVVEVEISGPTSAIDVPGNRKGNTYRQVNIQDWWVDDQEIAVATRQRSECWLDGEKFAEVDDRELPLFVYTFDSERYYLLDFRPAGGLLEINSRWPYANSAHPVLFGRAFSNVPLTECLANGFDLLRTEQFHDQTCSVVAFAAGRGRVLMWVSRVQPALALREEYHDAEGLKLTRDFEFESTPTGFKSPKRGTETRAERAGAITTVWTITKFEFDPVLPAYVFTPSFDEAAIVIDRSTGQTLKGSK